MKYTIAVSSGTTALHIALDAFGIGPGNEVIVSPYTFIASDSAVLEQNAIPVFVDIDPVHLGLDPADVERKITHHPCSFCRVSVPDSPLDVAPPVGMAHGHWLLVLKDGLNPWAQHTRDEKSPRSVRWSIDTFKDRLSRAPEGGTMTTYIKIRYI